MANVNQEIIEVNDKINDNNERNDKYESKKYPGWTLLMKASGQDLEFNHDCWSTE